MKVNIYPYKAGSKSVQALKEATGIKAISLKNSRYVGGENKIVINWGASSMPDEVLKSVVINKPSAVKLASNKLKFFTKVSGEVSIPDFTVEYEKANEWIHQGETVVVREKLTGNSGEGIVLINDIANWQEYDHQNAKMYVKYIPKKDEFRVHVAAGEVIDVQRKARRKDFPNHVVNWQVRNHNNGFIFAREGVTLPDGVAEECVKAVQMVGLDFGAVDVVYNTHRKKGYVLEVNTAPGLEGSSVGNYIEGLTKIFETKGFRRKRVTYPAGLVPPLYTLDVEIEQFLTELDMGVDSAQGTTTVSE